MISASTAGSRFQRHTVDRETPIASATAVSVNPLLRRSTAIAFCGASGCNVLQMVA
jgi:hypothetical protein